VSGASGFLGSRLVEFLKTHAQEIIIIGRTPLDGFDFIYWDIDSDVFPSIAVDRIDVVFHVAGYAHDIAGHSQAAKYLRCNVNATKSLSDFAVNFGVNRFLYVSSAKAGGEGSAFPTSESSGGSPNSFYGQSKKEAEDYLVNLKSNEMSISIIRPVLIYGPDMKGNLSQLKTAIKAGFPRPPKGILAKKSMIHVDDCVRGMVHLIGLSPSDRQVYLITDNRDYSPYEIDSALSRESFLMRARFPLWLMAVLRMIPFFSTKFDKLYGSNLYSSKKINATGFHCKASICDIDLNLF
jgi:UDP-glucose 4-epimerase